MSSVYFTRNFMKKMRKMEVDNVSGCFSADKAEAEVVEDEEDSLNFVD